MGETIVPDPDWGERVDGQALRENDRDRGLGHRARRDRED